MDDTFIIVDTETTGLDPNTAKVVEVAWLKVDIQDTGRRRLEDFSDEEAGQRYVNPKTDIPIMASCIHHITAREVSNAPGIYKDIIPIKDEIIVGHNLKFDIEMLKNNGLNLSNRPYIDTLTLAQKREPLAYNHKLVSMYYHLNLHYHTGHSREMMAAHTALFDCWLTYKILFALLDQHKHKFSRAEQVQQLLNLAPSSSFSRPSDRAAILRSRARRK